MFWDVFIRLCNSKRVSPNAVARACGVRSSGTVSAWKRGALPREGVLTAIADYFGVTVDQLMGGTQEKEDSAKNKLAYAIDVLNELQGLRDEDRVLLDVARGMTPEQVKMMTDFARMLKGDKQD